MLVFEQNEELDVRAVLQRVSWARVKVDGEVTGEIGGGLLALLGVAKGDTEKEAEMLAKKTTELRIFEDEAGKMNRSLLEVGGGCLVVSQFTLFAECRKGRRPFFGNAEAPQRAAELCQRFAQSMRGLGVDVATGVFGAMMHVELCNTGPVTIPLDTDDLSGPRRS